MASSLSSLTKMLMVSLEPGGNGRGKVGNGGGGGGGKSPVLVVLRPLGG